MPFTLAHPAAVLPFRKRLGRQGLLSGLVIGSIAPDLAYFLPVGISGSQSHSLRGLFLFCVPLGILAWAFYLAFLRRFLLALTPRSVSLRVAACAKPVWSLSSTASVAASVLLGGATHLLWDSFTHSTGFAVQAFPPLSTQVPLFDWYNPRVFTVLQHVSTLGGLTLIALSGVRWFRTTHPEGRLDASPMPPMWRLFVLSAMIVPSSAVGVRLLVLGLSHGQAWFPLLQNHLGQAIFAAGSVFLATLLLAAMVWRTWEAWSSGPRGCTRARG